MIEESVVESPTIDDQYDEILERLQVEESKINSEIQRNRALLPNIVKKGTINLQIDQRIKKSFNNDQDPSNFAFYLSQRRESKQGIESAMTQCSQFATYSKSKYSDLKSIHNPNELFHQISTK